MFSLLPSLPAPTTPALLQPALLEHSANPAWSRPCPCASPGTGHGHYPAGIPTPSSCARRPGQWQGGCGGGSCLRLSCVYLEAVLGSWSRPGPVQGAAAAAGPVWLDNSGKRDSGGRSHGHCSAGHFPRAPQHQPPGDAFMSSLFAASAYFGGQAPRARTGQVPAGTPSPRCWPQTVLTAGQRGAVLVLETRNELTLLQPLSTELPTSSKCFPLFPFLW